MDDASELNRFSVRAHPELAAALRSRIRQIIEEWIEQLRLTLPVVASLSDDEVSDNLPRILPRMADVLECGDRERAAGLMAESPLQGINRYKQQYDIRQLMQEDDLLRRIILEQTHGALGRLMSRDEQVSVNAAVDLMLRQSVLAFVDQQQGQLRAAAEVELKFLSFLSHDLNNNLSSVTLHLQLLRQSLAASPQYAEDVRTLDVAQRAILDTVGGMGRLLQSERLRRNGGAVTPRPVDLRSLVLAGFAPLQRLAADKGVALACEVAADVVVKTDRELLSLVLQNLLGNAVKYSAKGTVRVTAERRGPGGTGQWVVAVGDEGPGIAAEHVSRIFESFRRGLSYGQPGMGLGLAIASQAANLMGAELTVESTVGVGSTFRLTLPPE